MTLEITLADVLREGHAAEASGYEWLYDQARDQFVLRYHVRYADDDPAEFLRVDAVAMLHWRANGPFSLLLTDAFTNLALDRYYASQA